MDQLRELLEKLRDPQLTKGHFLGVLHLLIGRTISKTDGTVVSRGFTWRELAQQLKELRFDKNLVKELELDPDSLSPKDRQKFWYSAIAAANVLSDKAVQSAEIIRQRLHPLGYTVSPPPGSTDTSDSGSKGKKSPKKS